MTPTHLCVFGNVAQRKEPDAKVAIHIDDLTVAVGSLRVVDELHRESITTIINTDVVTQVFISIDLRTRVLLPLRVESMTVLVSKLNR